MREPFSFGKGLSSEQKTIDKLKRKIDKLEKSLKLAKEYFQLDDYFAGNVWHEKYQLAKDSFKDDDDTD